VTEYDTVQQLLRHRAGDDGVGLKHADAHWSWREHLATASANAAALLAASDRDRPIHVGVLLGNTPEMLVQMAAAGLGGYVLAGINTTRRGRGLLADVRRADCQILVTDAYHRHLLDGLDLTDITVFDTSTPDWQRRVDAAPPLVAHRDVSATDPFMMIFTSGTSGEPKAVQVSQLMVTMSGNVLTERFGITASETCYLSMPLFHSNAVVGGWSVAINSGAAMAPAKFSASRFLDDLRHYDATYMNYVGKPLSYVLATPVRPDDGDNPLRVAFGNEASDRDIEDFSARFNVEVYDGFGSTENAIIITREPGTPRGSIGKGFSGVAIFNSDTVTECPPATFDRDGALTNAADAIGQLVNTSGLGFFGGYYNDEAATAERTRHGVYWSGDLAYRDPEGWIYLAGRTADWMRVDGENIAGAPLERILLRCKVISRVAVYAVKDDNVGDQIMAAIVLTDDATLTPARLESFLADQPDLSAKSWPRYVRISPDLPTTATHKVLKRDLITQGATPGDGTLWVREPRETAYQSSLQEASWPK
jgi:fatty-acyl-CoA synthase